MSTATAGTQQVLDILAPHFWVILGNGPMTSNRCLAINLNVIVAREDTQKQTLYCFDFLSLATPNIHITKMCKCVGFWGTFT